MSIPVYLAVEDELSEWVLRRVLQDRPAKYAVGPVYGLKGAGYLKKQAPAFNNAAKGCPFLLLTDLDSARCPSELISDWLGNRTRHPRFLLRVAVHEVESWLLADREGLEQFLSTREKCRAQRPDDLPDPKQELLRLAYASSRRPLREDLVWRNESSGRYFQGPDYNGVLARFVLKLWNLQLARSRSSSLERLITALGRLEADLSAA